MSAIDKLVGSEVTFQIVDSDMHLIAEVSGKLGKWLTRDVFTIAGSGRAVFKPGEVFLTDDAIVMQV